MDTTTESASATSRATDIPNFLSHLPRYGDLPVPYFTAVVNGRPNFRAHDAYRHRDAMVRRLCGVCGRPLGYWMVFVMGPSSLAARLSYMPGNHEGCASYALRACPFLALQERDRGHRSTPGFVTLADPVPKPERVALASTRDYKVVVRTKGEPGTEYARFAPPKTVRWFGYVDGKLQAEG